jgi:nucleoside-diphosphate-sugar epimerase
MVKEKTMKKILIIGAAGQIGTELVLELERKFGRESVIASDIKEECPKALKDSNYKQLNILDKEGVSKLVKEENVTDVYLLAALLSATAEKNPAFAWELNMDGLFNILNLAKDGFIKKVFWPSSIAVFGPTTPKVNTPQRTIMEPTTIYGISKQAGEQWCAYYNRVHGVDVRSIRYPGLISYTSLPGGGTTDYAVDIFHSAVKGEPFSCFLSEDTKLPMIYMEDAIRATLELMAAPADSLSVRTSYNLQGMSFSPGELYAAIQKYIPNFEISYAPDERQKIAEAWPKTIDDHLAREDWNWKPGFQLDEMAKDMIINLQSIIESNNTQHV